jgi:DNA-binding transcriptional LysR family regulator
MIIWFDMNPTALKIYCDVIRLQSFSGAADENNITQAAVSQNIQQLEKRLGVQLIDRKKRPFQVTQEGSMYFEGCKELVARYYDLEAEIKLLKGEVRGVVKVAAIYSAGLADISLCVQRFTKLYPLCSVQLSFVHPHKVYQSVIEGEVDLGIISYPRLKRELDVVSWRDETMVVVCSPIHEFAKKDVLKFRDFSAKRMIAFDSDLVIRKEIDRFLKQQHAEPDVCLEFDNVETIKRAVEIGEGFAILPEPTVAAEVRSGSLISIALPRPGLVRPLGIVFRRNRLSSCVSERFVEMIKTTTETSSKKRAA